MFRILQHEVKYYFKNLHEVIYFSCFFVLIALIVPMGLRQQLNLLPELGPIGLSIALLAATGLGAASLYQRDAESGMLETYQQLPDNLHGLVLAKWLAFYIAILLPCLIFLPAFLLLSAIPMEQWALYSKALAAEAAVLSILASLGAVITVGLERARAVMFLLVMPLSVPAVIFTCAYLQNPAEAASISLVIAMSVFLLPILCLAGAGCIRASK
jgi:heme exporter protein B